MMRFAENCIEEFCQMTVAMLLVYFHAISVQVHHKKRLAKEFQDKGKKFSRYTNPTEEMLRSDRCVANILEWLPFFFGLLSTNILLLVTPSLTSSSPLPPLPFLLRLFGWGYVLFRAGYVYSVSNGNFASNGIQKGLFFATIPAYLCLIGMFVMFIGKFIVLS